MSRCPHCHRRLFEIDYYGERHARARIVHIELDVARGFRDQSSGSDEKKPDPVLDSQSGFSDPQMSVATFPWDRWSGTQSIDAIEPTGGETATQKTGLRCWRGF